MNARLLTSFLCLSAVGALAFEAGRRTQPAATSAQELPPLSVAASDSSHLPVLDSPLDLQNLPQLPFANAFKAFKSASPEKLTAWMTSLQQIKPRPTRAAALTSFFKTLIQFEPALAVRLIKQLKDEERWDIVMMVKDAAPPRAMEHVVDLLRFFPPEKTSGCGFSMVRDAIDEWASFDPTAVSRYFEENRQNPEFFAYTAVLVRRWAAYDPEGAREWAGRVLEQGQTIEGVDREWAISNAIYVNSSWIEGYRENDPAAAMDYIVEFQNRRDITNAIPFVARAMFLESPDEARSFVLRLDEKRQMKALQGIDSVADREVHHDGDDWKTAPKYVAEWMLEFPQAIWKPAISGVLAQWHEDNPGNLFTWMSQLPAGTRQMVADQYQLYLSEDDIGTKFTETIRVADIGLREQLLTNFMKAAKDLKPQTLNLLQTAQLSEEQKRYFASLIPDEDYREPSSPTEEEDEVVITPGR